MLLRYLILFGGIVTMITGCNNLVSQNFGTHALRTISAAGATAAGIGAADYLEITGVDLGLAQLTVPADDLENGNYVFRPLLTPSQADDWAAGQRVATNLVGWFKSQDPACGGGQPCLPGTGARVIGLVNAPRAGKNPLGEWSGQRISLVEPVVYLEVGQAPLAWYWNLALFLGGALLAFLPEARRHRRRLTAPGTSPESVAAGEDSTP